MRKVNFAFCAALAVSAMSGRAFATDPTNALVLNEANCVSGSSYLKVSSTGVGTDTGMIGARVQGNGNNWMELLVAGESDSVNHALDIRGYTITYSDDHGSGTIYFKDVDAFAAVPLGTLITITEFKQVSYNSTATEANGGHVRWGGIDGYGQSVTYNGHSGGGGTVVDFSTDTNVDPSTGDWNMQIWGGDTSGQTGPTRGSDANGDYAESDYFVFRGVNNGYNVGDPSSLSNAQQAGLFTINNNNWQMSITDASNNDVMDPVGEAVTTPEAFGGGGVSNEEVIKLQADSITDPNSATYNYAAHYGNALMSDGKESTMGAANVWSAGTEHQDLTSVRSW